MSGNGGATSEAREADRRVQRTRAALRSAFNRLILSRGYDDISPAEIAAAADVGRSTFYEHFRSKEDLLAQAIAPVLEPLAAAGFAAADEPRLAAMLEHFWDNRKLARALMTGRAHAAIARMLAALIETRLADVPAPDDALPPALAAVQLAHGRLALVEAWLSGRHGCSAAQIAAAMGAQG